MSELEDLTQLLYLSPVGLLRVAEDGDIQIINSMAAQMLLPLKPDSDLKSLLPLLRAISTEAEASWSQRSGTVRTCISVQHDLWMELTWRTMSAGFRIVSLRDVGVEVRLDRDRQARAIEVNDQVLQNMIVAQALLDLGEVERARALVAKACDLGRAWVGAQLKSSEFAATGQLPARGVPTDEGTR